MDKVRPGLLRGCRLSTYYVQRYDVLSFSPIQSCHNYCACKEELEKKPSTQKSLNLKTRRYFHSFQTLNLTTTLTIGPGRCPAPEMARPVQLLTLHDENSKREREPHISSMALGRFLITLADHPTLHWEPPCSAAILQHCTSTQLTRSKWWTQTDTKVCAAAKALLGAC